MAAISWGGGDFSGGMGSKAAGGSVRGTLRVLVTAYAMSLVALLLLVAVRGEWQFQGWPVFWGLSCGCVAALSITAFYLSLARGTMGASAAVSGLLAAAIPAGVGTVLDGRPTALRLTGFLLAAASIWLIAAGENGEPAQTSGQGPSTMTLAIAGGIGFGLFFVGLRLANSLGVIEPLALARAGGIVTSLAMLFLAEQRRTNKNQRSVKVPWLSRAGWGWAVGVAVLDTGGNLLYIAATRAGRLDVAAVLASLYPASTILLAAVILRERVGRRQALGMAVAIAAVVMVAL